VVSRGALTVILFEATQVARSTVLAGVSETDITFGEDLWISFVCNTEKTKRVKKYISRLHHTLSKLVGISFLGCKKS